MSERVVYFIRPVGMDGPVKIGWTDRAAHRLDQLTTWSPWPLEIAATVPGSFKLESRIHACFANSHSHKEWFHPTPRLLDAIAKLQAGASIEEAIDFSLIEGSIRRQPIRRKAADQMAPQVEDAA